MTVVGGGLAGLTAALSLAELGVQVRLIEAAPHLGGMCGSRVVDDYVEDHGFHIVQPWYPNVNRLIDRLGIADRFADCPDYYQLLPGEFPKFRNFQALFTLRDLVRDIRSGVTSPANRVLFYYLLVDLLSQRYSYGGKQPAHDVPIDHFLDSRWYLTPAARQELTDVIVTASAWDFSRASAATFRAGIAAATHYKQLVRMPTGNLEDSIVTPFRRRLEKLGAQIVTDCELLRVEVTGNRVTGLTFSADQPYVAGDPVILAIPHTRLAALGAGVLAAPRSAGPMTELRSRPLGALHLHVKAPLPELPSAHVRLVGSSYGISLIDVAKQQETIDGATVNCVIGQVEKLRGLPEEAAIDRLLDEIIRYLPCLHREDITRIYYQPHYDEPFFLPDFDSWRLRPQARTDLDNLYLAGDFCALPPGAVAMEAAVMSGLIAAESVRSDLQAGPGPIEILHAKDVSRRAASGAKVALAPVAGIARLLA